MHARGLHVWIRRVMNGYECACMEHNWLCSTRTGRLRCDGMWTVGCWFSRYVRQTDLTGRACIDSESYSRLMGVSHLHNRWRNKMGTLLLFVAVGLCNTTCLNDVMPKLKSTSWLKFLSFPHNHQGSHFPVYQMASPVQTCYVQTLEYS